MNITRGERDELVKLLGPLSLISFNAHPSWLDRQLVAREWVSGFGQITFGECRRAGAKVKELLSLSFQDNDRETEMTWEQKLTALQALTATHLEMRKPGDWYVSAYSREIVRGSLLVRDYGNGTSPEESVNDDWDRITSHGEYIRVPSGSFRWNGFMWEAGPK